MLACRRVLLNLAKGKTNKKRRHADRAKYGKTEHDTGTQKKIQQGKAKCRTDREKQGDKVRSIVEEHDTEKDRARHRKTEQDRTR